MKEEKFHPTKFFALLGDEVVMLDIKMNRYFAFNLPGALLYNQLQMKHREIEALLNACSPSDKDFLQALAAYELTLDEPIPETVLMNLDETMLHPTFRYIGDASTCTMGVSPPGSVVLPSGS